MPGTSRTIANDIPIIPSPHGASLPEDPRHSDLDSFVARAGWTLQNLRLKRAVRPGRNTVRPG